MIGKDDYLTPPKALSIAHAGATKRLIFELLVGFDARLGQIVARDGEVVVAQMRMAWWRDVIEKKVADRPSGEPMVAVLNKVEPSKSGDVKDAMGKIIDAWDLLLAHDDWSDEILLRHSKLRGTAIFQDITSGQNTGRQAAGQLWALHDLANLIDVNITGAIDQCGSGAKNKVKPRHLSILALAARRQYEGGGGLSGLRLVLRSLTGL